MYKEIEASRCKSRYVFTELKPGLKEGEGRYYKYVEKKDKEGRTYIELEVEVGLKGRKGYDGKGRKVLDVKGRGAYPIKERNVYSARNLSELNRIKLTRVYIEEGLKVKEEEVNIGEIVSSIKQEFLGRKKLTPLENVYGKEYKSNSKETKSVSYNIEKICEFKQGLTYIDYEVLFHIKIELNTVVKENKEKRKEILKNRIQGLDISQGGELSIRELYTKCYREDRRGLGYLEIPNGVQKVESLRTRSTETPIESIHKKVYEEKDVVTECVKLCKILDSIMVGAKRIKIEGGYLNVSEVNVKRLIKLRRLIKEVEVSELRVGSKKLSEVLKKDDCVLELSKKGKLSEKKKDVYVCKLKNGYTKPAYGSRSVYEPLFYGISLKTLEASKLKKINEMINMYIGVRAAYYRDVPPLERKKEEIEEIEKRLKTYMLKVIEENEIEKKLKFTEEEKKEYRRELERYTQSVLTRETRATIGEVYSIYHEVVILKEKGIEYYIVTDEYNSYKD